MSEFQDSNGILKCFFVDLKDFWRFKAKSKFCQKLKIFISLAKFQILITFLSLSNMTCE